MTAREDENSVDAAAYPALQGVAPPDAVRLLDLTIAVVPELDYAGYVSAFAVRSTIARAWSGSAC